MSSHTELPWWKKGPEEGDDHKTAPDKTMISKGKTSKSAKKRSVQSKVEQKSHRASITSSYLQRMSSSSKKSAELEAALKEAQRRTAELAEDHKVNVEELDLPVHWFKEHEMSKGASADATVVKVTQLTPKKCHRTWFQRSFIIFTFLHPMTVPSSSWSVPDTGRRTCADMYLSYDSGSQLSASGMSSSTGSNCGVL